MRIIKGTLLFITYTITLLTIIGAVIEGINRMVDQKAYIYKYFYNLFTMKVPAELRIVRKYDHYYVQKRDYIFWHDISRSGYSKLENAKIDYNEWKTCQKRATELEVIKLPEESQLYKTMNK